MRGLFLLGLVALCRAAPAPDADPADPVRSRLIEVNPCANEHIVYYITGPSTPCDVYYQCVHGQYYERRCPANLVFDLEKRYCDYGDCPNPAGPFPMVAFDLTGIEADECLNGEYLYKRIDAHTYEQWTVDRTFLDQTHECASGIFMGKDGTEQSKCYCDEAPKAVVVEPFDPLSTCNIWKFEGKDTDVWVGDSEVMSRSDLLDGVIVNNNRCFLGMSNSFQTIPFYEQNDWTGGMTIEFKYRFDTWATTTGKINIIHNGNYAVEPMIDPMVRVALDNSKEDREEISVKIHLTDGSSCVVDQELMHPDDRSVARGYVKVLTRYDGTTLRLQINDGEEVQATCPGAIAVTSQPMTLGYGFLGCMDDIHICKADFNPSE